MKDNTRNPIWVTFIAAVCLLFFLVFLLYVFTDLPFIQRLGDPLFNSLNPFTTGVYLLGCGLLITLQCARGKTGMILGLLMAVSYLVMAAISLVALMGLSGPSDLLMYGPNVIIVILGIMIMVRRGKEG